MKNILRAGGALLGIVLSIALFSSPTQAATSYTIAPATATVQSGRSVDFTITKSVNGVTSDAAADATLSTDDPSGTIQGMTYFAGTIGSWSITATVDNTTTSAKITVTPGAVTRLVVTPHDETVRVEKGKTQQFKATAYDGHNNVVPNAEITWAGVYSIGTINKNGLFTATANGSSQVIATSGTGIDTVTVTVYTPQPTPPANTNTGNTQNTNTTTNQSDEPPSNTNTASEEPVAETTECSSLPWWGWLGTTVLFLGIVYGYHYYIRHKKSSLWLLGTAALTGVGLWLYFAYRCGDQYTWVAWIMGIGASILAVLRPQTFHSNYGSDL